jgi:hypothetical protein
VKVGARLPPAGAQRPSKRRVCHRHPFLSVLCVPHPAAAAEKSPAASLPRGQKLFLLFLPVIGQTRISLTEKAGKAKGKEEAIFGFGDACMHDLSPNRL